MKRYYTRPRQARSDYEWLDSEPLTPGLSVYEPESPHVFSGLLDADGNELYSTSRRPIGFIDRREG